LTVGSSITLEDLESDPDPVLARLRSEEPVSWVPALDMWLVTRWDDVAAIEADPTAFTAATEPSFLARALGPNLLTCDPPEHTRLQRVLQPPFRPGGRSGTFSATELPVLADRILDSFVGTADAGRSSAGDRSTEPVDLMAGYAQPLAAGALAVVLGLDAHGFDTMWRWCLGLCADIANFGNDPELTALGERAKAELGAAITERIAATTPDDRSAIASFVRDGATTDEIINNVRLMISGGINEPRDGIGLVTWVLLSRPDLRARIDTEPRLLSRLVEEVFRLHSPVGTVTRMTTIDTVVGGVTIPAGQLVAGVLRSINLDEGHWTNPGEIDLDRREGPHAAFALGAHRCLGEWLGRQEVRVGVERLLRRYPDLSLSPDHPVELAGFEFRGPRELWVIPSPPSPA
jgi:cytochrome P450